MRSTKNYATMIIVVIFLLFATHQLLLQIDQNRVVPTERINDYALNYIETYKYLAEKYISPDNRTYLQFYMESPYLIKATISITHGAGIEFIPSKTSSFQTTITDKNAEDSIFNMNEYAFAKNFYYKNATVFHFSYNNSPCFSGFGKNDGIAYIYFQIDGRRPFASVLEYGSVLVQGVAINGIYYNYVFIKGSNRNKDWTNQTAFEDASNNFESDLRYAFTKSEELREYLAESHSFRYGTSIDTKE